MATAAVIPPMRVAGWNIHLVAGQRPSLFAGVYQQPGSDLLTFRDLIDELRLCFEPPRIENETSGSWDGIAFASAPLTSVSPAFVKEENFHQPVPSLPPHTPRRPRVIKYHVIRHRPCSLPENSPLASHIQARCAQHVSQPLRRRDPRYLAPKRTSSDPKFAAMPVRKRMKRRGSQSPKRPPSGSSPTRKDNQDDDKVDVIAPLSMNIDYEEAKKVMDNFRSSILVSACCCAISGLGESWCVSPVIGLALQACHIVPQNHYHLYPGVDAYPADDEESTRRIHQAWKQTWNAKNGILLMSHLHEAFDSRLVSINPETRRIRAFVPYNVLTPYHGQEAILPDNVDLEALRHHYDMCCIENMAAEMPMVESIPTRLATSGTSTPFSPRTDLPATPFSDTDASTNHDPAKRLRPGQPDQPHRRHSQPEDGDGTSLEPEQECKRQRLDDVLVENESSPEPEWGQEDVSDSYITPWNSDQFLADVNWELRKYTAT